MTILPPSRPRIPEHTVTGLLVKRGVRDEVAVVGLRGYYARTMGGPGNDRGIYDDCICVRSPSGFVTFNANVDPSISRPGVAVLADGVWRYKPGIHGLSKPPERRYPAFVQADEVTVHRDGRGDDTGWFGINIHRGSNTTTSSLGCQTIPPSQWQAFYSLVISQLQLFGQKTFPYLLTQSI